MIHSLDVDFVPVNADLQATCVAFAGEELAFSPRLAELNTRAGGTLLKAAEAADFKGKAKTAIEVLAPPRLDLARLLIVGAGKTREMSELDCIMLGGAALGHVSARKTKTASLIADVPGGGLSAVETACALAFGAVLRHYNFTKYQTRARPSAEEGEANGPQPARDGIERLVVHCAEPEKTRTAFARYRAVADGVNLARELVNEPANALGPVEFAERAKILEQVGVEVEILDVEALTALKMNALLGVARGSERPGRVVVMQWQGAKSKRAKPLAFVGKGVVFDTGGISIKPAQGMEDMKGDMGGAACVTGLMYALAARKAAVNAVGVIGCVENMPSGSAQRPGDIVTSMSGQTIEVLNTDAEGRLVLADVLWYAQQRFKPRLVIDLATLTGAIMVALGKEYAGLFSNDDKLAGDLLDAAAATGEKVWRMPLAKAYDKLIESKNADMKNIGGRWAGAITAAQFLQRFIKDTPWAHIDLAGTAMDAPRTDINVSWGSGWGVRLLDRFVADKHERG